MSDAPDTTSSLLCGSDADAYGQLPVATWKEFLECVPPGQWYAIKEALRRTRQGPNVIDEPELNLYCNSDSCSRIMSFRCTTGDIYFEKERNAFLVYMCKNCDTDTKSFAIFLRSKPRGYLAYKYGEFPNFGPPIPRKTLEILGSDRELYFNGHRSEIQGLGLGAFSYYRRVVENQKNKLFDTIIRVVNKTQRNQDLLAELEIAKKETQFKNAIDKIKSAIPESLLINGENPLTLLHDALSAGIHNDDDSECLVSATAIRTVLDEFLAKAFSVLKNDGEVAKAIGQLKAIRAKKNI